MAGVSTTSTSTTSTVVPETTSTTFNFCGGAGTSCGPCPNGQMSICYMLRDGGNACPSPNSCQASTCTTNAECPAGKACFWNYFAPFEATCCDVCTPPG